MTDNPQQEMTEGDRKTHSVTHGEFTNFLVAKAPEKPCPECGVNDWGTNVREDQTLGDDAALQVAFFPGWHTTLVMPVHTLHCTNCGYVKAFAATIVRNWVVENAAS